MERRNVIDTQPVEIAEEISPAERQKIGQLQAEAAAFWSREKKEGEPRIKFKIAYGGHVGSKDLESWQEDFKACDVYIPESFGWIRDTMFENLSGGLISPETAERIIRQSQPNWKNNIQRNFVLGQMKMLYRSHKAIVIIDVPNEHDLVRRFQWLSLRQEEKINSNNLEEKKGFLKEYLTESATIQRSREIFMFTLIPFKIKEVLARRPDLAKRPELRVLISLGASHTYLFHMMNRKNSENTERSFPSLPFTFGLLDATQRAIAFGLADAQDLSNELVTKIVMEVDCLANLRKSMIREAEKYPTPKFIEKVTRYVNMFSTEEITEFYKQLETGKKFRNLFLEFLSKKGVVDPSL